MQKFKRNKGFTLVELLVVVAILAVLAATLLPRFLPLTDSARAAVAAKDMKTLNSVVQIWAAQNGHYPTPSMDLEDPNSIASVLQSKGIKWTGDKTGVTDPWGNPYYYDVGEIIQE